MRTFFMLVLVALIFSSCQQQEKIIQNYKIEFGKVAKHSRFDGADTASFWGGSVIKGNDGLYHMLYSRWPKHIGWEWANYSIIAHATSSSPFGPYQHVDIALPERGSKFWDGSATHNPTVHKIKGKYYLYYMGNFGDKKIVSVPGKAKINWMHRNNQRIGVAVAENPCGPWKRFDKPVLDVTHGDSTAHDALVTNNPSVCKMPDGKILMVYKAVGKKFPLPAGGPVVHMVAIADNPTGPFKKFPDPVFTFEGERFPAEDPYIWYQDGKYRAIVKRIEHIDHKRVFSLVHYDSFDGIHWERGKYFHISDRILTWEDGRVVQYDHLERPQVLMEDGEPIALICAADVYDENNIRQSFNVQIPLIITKEVE
ncbi:glycoside hydrolase family protein [uncultured Draconibacterium sp.]|uniref:glycoside hydrolase family protein n=1 Tax=uncultured Draconibacterium sp. TaxID=1573823 RepID=UPI0025F82080|nr:glycoside hydrolase family protein [uncultured Draconibacterium sp.]